MREGGKCVAKKEEGWGNEGTPSTHERNTPLMNPKIGMNVVLVRLLARENRKLVAADTGVAKLSYSSAGRVSIFDIVKRNPRRTDRDADIVDGVALPQALPPGVKRQLREHE
jgi:hypothetical protein